MRIQIGLAGLLLGFVFSSGIWAQASFVKDPMTGTISCAGANAGDTGEIDGITYAAVDNTTIRTKANDEEDMSVLCTTLVTDMSSLFNGLETFNDDIGSWDVSNVTTMSWMFYTARAFMGDISSWDVSNVTDMSSMFRSSTSFNQVIDNWDVSSVTDMRSMFQSAFAFNGNIGGWDVSNVTNMGSMFEGAIVFSGDIGGWDVSNVTNMTYMFYMARAFNADIGGWDVSNVANMTNMFYGAEVFNQNIGSWDVSNVTEMVSMFRNAQVFNQDLSGWCVTNITSAPFTFAASSALNPDFYPVWGSCPNPSSNEMEILPQKFALQQNYPNPFNPATNIQYSVAERGSVMLSVYNVMGQKIAELVNESKVPGIYVVSWNADNLSSGLYFYRLSQNGNVITRRMMLIK